jgi:hypothetical protein
MNFRENHRRTTKCQETPIFVGYILWKRVKSHRNEFWCKSSPEHKMPWNTNFHALYPAKTREKSHKWILVKIFTGPQIAPKHKISWAIPFENVWEVRKIKCCEKHRWTTKCPESQNFMGYNLWKRLRSHKNEISQKLSLDQKMPRNTNFNGLHSLKTRENSQKEIWGQSSPDHKMPWKKHVLYPSKTCGKDRKWNVTKTIAIPQNSPKH